MSPMRVAFDFAQPTLTDMADGDLLSKFQINGSGEQCARISGIDITREDNILITDSWKQNITIYDQAGGCLFSKTFDNDNVWDCACLKNGHFAVLTDDAIKVFADNWTFRRKIPIRLPKPRQLTADSDDFFIVLDAKCENVATYHAKSGSPLSNFPTSQVQLARQDSGEHRRRSRPSPPRYEAMGTGLAVNSKDLIYIADPIKSTIRVFTHYGAQCEELNFPCDGKSQLSRPLGLCMGSGDSIIVADSGNDRVVKFSADWSECKTILDKEDGLVKPVAVAVTADKKLVIIDGDTNTYIVKCD